MTSLYVESDGDLPPSQLLARRIREVIAGRQISGTKVAESIDLDQRAFSRRYRGITPWTVDELYQLATALGVELSELLPRLDSNQQPFVSPSTQVSEVDRHLGGHLATVSRIFPGPEIAPSPGPVPSPTQPASPVEAAAGSRATHPSPNPSTTAATAPVGGATVVDLDDHRFQRLVRTIREETA